MIGPTGGELLLRRLQSVAVLNPNETALILSLNQRPRRHPVRSQISADGFDSSGPRLIVSGWACRPRILPDGRCQILSTLLPGDLAGDTGDGRPLAQAAVIALTDMATVGARSVFDTIARDPGLYRNLGRGLQALGRMEEAQLLDHVVRLGRQSAIQRVAHQLLEFYHRCRAVGLVDGGRFPMPLTQETLADMLGLSLVHVNRTITQLKRQNMIEVRSGIAHISDVAQLALIADYPAADEKEGAPRFGDGSRSGGSELGEYTPASARQQSCL
jgi:CRP-like cAMP-binding protein